MEKYQIIVKPKAESDFLKIERSGDKSSIKKLETIILELESHPYTGVGQPEQLKHHLTGYWSRRINKKDRLIYQVIEEPEQWVVIISALGHY
jgi:toxin YoeB